MSIKQHGPEHEATNTPSPVPSLPRIGIGAQARVTFVVARREIRIYARDRARMLSSSRAMVVRMRYSVWDLLYAAKRERRSHSALSASFAPLWYGLQHCA